MLRPPVNDLEALVLGIITGTFLRGDTAASVSVSPEYDERGNYLNRVVLTGNESGIRLAVDVTTLYDPMLLDGDTDVEADPSGRERSGSGHGDVGADPPSTPGS